MKQVIAQTVIKLRRGSHISIVVMQSERTVERMNSPCPYICNNKTEYGYCKTTGCINPKIIKDVFYDGYAYCLMDFGKDTVLCKDCKHQERIAGYSDYQPNTVFCN